ncbi:hypothetical protein [Asticcacaulis taihuensis]|jgi:hypothetical protein|uniref:Uncharacterized protein n=1 Tax=Asticcacaulis taihuensis TaxID=260084 RepID=A0A1G4QX43_9CAUL|nr:hypothetical protein [Asticcacaulis taihuensis]SCW49176.1 hypothetical protein SAMN02927928_1590 [Asticcacaulis taihuensis]
MAIKEQLSKEDQALPWLIGAFVAGVVTMFTLVMLALRLYVDIDHPYVVVAIVLCLFSVLTWICRNRASVKPSVASQVLIVIGQSLLLTTGAAGTFYFLMSIYPPN